MSWPTPPRRPLFVSLLAALQRCVGSQAGSPCISCTSSPSKVLLIQRGSGTSAHFGSLYGASLHTMTPAYKSTSTGPLGALWLHQERARVAWGVRSLLLVPHLRCFSSKKRKTKKSKGSKPPAPAAMLPLEGKELLQTIQVQEELAHSAANAIMHVY